MLSSQIATTIQNREWEQNTWAPTFNQLESGNSTMDSGITLLSELMCSNNNINVLCRQPSLMYYLKCGYTCINRLPAITLIIKLSPQWSEYVIHIWILSKQIEIFGSTNHYIYMKMLSDALCNIFRTSW